MANPSTAKWIVDCRIGDLDENLSKLVQAFEWKSMVNGGFIVRAKLEDPYFEVLNKIIEGRRGRSRSGREAPEPWLDSARQHDNPTLVRFKCRWAGDRGLATPERVALISDLHALGNEAFSGGFEFIAVDPVSYYINSGDASGNTYTGKIGGKNGIIDQVIKEYVRPDIEKLGFNLDVEVGDTDDQENNYNQMRMDPKTFISSMLEWSSSFTKHKTHWIVANGQDDKDPRNLKIEVKESHNADLKWPKDVTINDGVTANKPFVLRYGGVDNNPVPDIFKWEFLADNFISALNTKMVTSGMSAVSGEYLDRIVDQEEEKIVFVKDENTDQKTNPTLTAEQGFTKPTERKRGWTSINSIPEHNAGDVGVPYKRYVDGRARQTYMNMLNMLMRLKISVRGQPRMFDSTELGRTRLRLKWLKVDPDGGGQTRFLDGDWLIYGWHHKFKINWHTDIYLARLDWDASAVPGPR